MKKRFLVFFACFLLLSVLIMGCSKSEETISEEVKTVSEEVSFEAEDAPEPADQEESFDNVSHNDTNISEVTDVFDYFNNYEDLISKLDMKWDPDAAWQFGGENSYTSHGFYLEYLEDYGSFSMKNEGSPYVSFCGVMLGDKLDILPDKLTERGWKFHADYDKSVEYYLIRDDDIYIVMFYRNSDDTVAGWYTNNWPEGEDYTDLYET